jgi:hypothetical protein
MLSLFGILFPAGCWLFSHSNGVVSTQLGFSRRSTKSPGSQDGSKWESGIMDEQRRGAFQSLKPYCGAELTTLRFEQTEELLNTLSRLLPRRKAAAGRISLPWYFWEFGEKKALYLLFEVESPTIRPGSTVLRLTLFDHAGEVLCETIFNTGHRCYLQSVELRAVDDTPYPLLVMTTDVTKQYIGFVGSRFDLIRVEDHAGIATRNKYYLAHYTCGPSVPEQTGSEWEADLLTGDSLKILRALVWLGGRHRQLEALNPIPKGFESVADINRVREVRSRQRVPARLKDLSQSENRWLQEAAWLALNPDDVCMGPVAQ